MKDCLTGRLLPLLSYEATTSLLSRGNWPLQLASSGQSILWFPWWGILFRTCFAKI